MPSQRNNLFVCFTFVLSPLIRNQKYLQEELRDEMLGRLDTLEKKLLRQIRKSVLVPDNKQKQVISTIEHNNLVTTIKFIENDRKGEVIWQKEGVAAKSYEKEWS